MGRRNEKIRRDEESSFCVSRNIYSVRLTQGSNRNTPSPFNFKHFCKHLLVSHFCICVGKMPPVLVRLCTDKTSASYLWTVIFLCSHASHLLSRWRARGDEKQTIWGETRCKEETFRWEMCGFGKQKLDSSRWSQTPYPNRGLRLSGIKIVLKTAVCSYLSL